MNKDYNEKLDYLMKYLSKESIATMLLNTSEGDKLVSNYIEIRQIENITNLKKVKVEDKKIAKIGKLNQVSDKQHLNNYILRNKINEIIDKLNGEDNEN